MIRNILAVIGGLAVGMAVNMALVMLNAYVLFPMPQGTSMQDTEQFKAYIATLPTTAFLVVLAAHLGQAFAGGLVSGAWDFHWLYWLAPIIGATLAALAYHGVFGSSAEDT